MGLLEKLVCFNYFIDRQTDFIFSIVSTQIFLVRREIGQKLIVMAVRLPDHQGEPHIQEWHVQENGSCKCNNI